MSVTRRWAGMGAALLLAATACRFPTAGGPALVALVGQWDYAATQTTPTPATLSGTLTISQQSGNTFQGSLVVTQRDASGNLTQLSGVVSGRMLDPTSLTFDAFFALTGRHHLGALAQDSLTGSWVEQTTASVTSGGSFTAVLRAAP